MSPIVPETILGSFGKESLQVCYSAQGSKVIGVIWGNSSQKADIIARYEVPHLD
jgi:hypothetical protein